MRISNIFQKKEKPLDFESLFIILASGVVLVGWLALFLTIAQVFLKPLIVIGIILIAFLTSQYLKSYQSVQAPTKTDFLVVLFVIFFSLFIAAFAHESFLCGRDDGEYSNWAYYLAQHGTYRLKETDTPKALMTALVRPGITKPDFQFGYISWLALHGAFLGIEGIKIGNFLPLIIGLLSLYFIGKKIGNKKVGIFTILMLSTSFVLIWYSRQTMSETFSLALIWFAILSLLKAYQEDKSNLFVISLLSLGLFLFTKPEGMWIFTMLLVVIPFLYLSQGKRWLLNKKILFVLVIILLFFFYYSFVIQPVYFNAILKGIGIFIADLFRRTFEISTGEDISFISKHPTFYILNILGAYNMLLPILLSIPVILKAFLSWRRQKNTLILLICFLVAPTFIFLFRLTLFYDHPWMLRRYLPTILPLSCLLTALFLEKFSGKFKYILLFLILADNLLISAPILTFAQFNGIVNSQIKNIAESLPDEAVILCESKALGFRAPLRFIFGKRTIFTYANEINNFLNKVTSQSVYVVAAEEEGGMLSFLPSGSAELISKQIVRYQILEDIVHIYDPSIFVAEHRIFQKTPKKITDLSVSLNVYKINDNYKRFMPDQVVIYPGDSWHFNENSLKLPTKNVGSLYLYFPDSQSLKMQIEGRPSQICLEGKEKCRSVEASPDNQGWITISFKEEEVKRKYERVKLVIYPGKEDFLIKKIIVE
ncbi:MAG: glycosyltransferase family 39 protein [Candidatus Marinimicrobia bacterium]|nr:glycosyltransferase family 39 protein [Candidatus Neomarinimicrobiota bacterium]